ncbi:MAG: extracellular solute-binding protein [Clostridiales bacterium]|jgi:putative aldouronate transport system substrate-binding protein|nr:extracellular solute-binding protein [Clostridiales bacterium]
MKRTLVLLLLVTMLLGNGLLAAFAQTPELVDGKFTTTREITVEIFDRANEGGSKPEDNFYTDYIKKGMLEKYNVAVTYVPVPRWTEVDALNNLLAAGDAPDVCVTYSYPTIQTYAEMGGVTDLAPYLSEHKDLLPNLWELLGDQNIYWDLDPEKGTLWAIEAKLFVNKRINTFVREDWLKKLNIAEPKTLEEFEAMLVAFRDNAETLLGADKDKLIPYSTSYDVSWRNDHLITSFVPEGLTEKEAYVRGFDDRRMLFPNYKEGVRVLNKWYNDNLVWKDFPVHGAGDNAEDNLMKAGYVGAFTHNWDYPYRNGEDSIHANLQRAFGPEAGYIAVEPFPNDEGIYRKFLAAPIDRKVFFPATNDEPLASLLYLDFISTMENRRFLQIGEEGVTHEVQENGAIKTLAVQGEKIMNSLNNIDYTITINGLDTGDAEKNVLSIALGYASVEPRYIERAFELSSKDARYGKNYSVGLIQAEVGMNTSLPNKRDTFLTQSVVAPVDQFDQVYDSGMDDYLSSGGQAIIDERQAAYEKYYE